MPVTMLWIGKLIIDEVVRLIGLEATPGSLTDSADLRARFAPPPEQLALF